MNFQRVIVTLDGKEKRKFYHVSPITVKTLASIYVEGYQAASMDLTANYSDIQASEPVAVNINDIPEEDVDEELSNG